MNGFYLYPHEKRILIVTSLLAVALIFGFLGILFVLENATFYYDPSTKQITLELWGALRQYQSIPAAYLR